MLDQMLIDGQTVQAHDGRLIDIENPANHKIIAQVPRGEEVDVDRAVNAAARAFEQWRAVPARERGKLLLRIADAVEAETESIARIVALETGNAIRTQARPEVKSAADVFRYYGGVAGEVKGETIPLGELRNVRGTSKPELAGAIALCPPSARKDLWTRP